VNIIIVHPLDVVFPLAKALGKTTPLRWTLMMFTISADNNCIMSCISTLFLVVSESSSLSPLVFAQVDIKTLTSENDYGAKWK
jgi:cAMP phosphodiesterase